MNRKNVLIPTLYGTIFFLLFMIQNRAASVSEIVLRLSLGSIPNYKACFSDALTKYLMLLFAHILFGNRIYQNFCNAYAYFYVRTDNLKKWFLREIRSMFGEVIVYYGIVLLTVIIGSLFVGKLAPLSMVDIELVLCYFVLYTLYTMITCILINFLSIYLESNIALAIVEGLNLVCMGAYLITGDMFYEEYLIDNPWIFQWNPICHLMLYIHSDKLIDFNVSTVPAYMQIGIMDSMITFAIGTVVAILIGFILIDKVDLLGEKMEGV